MSAQSIPLVDLRAQYEAIKSEIDDAINGVIAETAFIGGHRVDDFARKFSLASQAKYCIPVANGTDAIYIVLKMLGVGPGDEVITVANSWISTSETITQTGAKPVFVDIDEYFHIDPARIEEAVTSKTKAIIPVHLYGQPADMRAVLAIAEAKGLYVVEDCAQAHLSQYEKRSVGTMGVAGTFSFYPGKNLGAYGDAGAIVTDDDQLARDCLMYANHGAMKKHEHLMEGINSRLDGLQAAILLAKLPFLQRWTEMRRKVAQYYDEALADIEQIETPRRRSNASHVFHLYVVRAANRDRLAVYLKENGVGCAIHYPTPLPLLPAYAKYAWDSADFKIAEKACEEILSLPIYPELSVTDTERIIGLIKSFYL